MFEIEHAQNIPVETINNNYSIYSGLQEKQKRRQVAL